MHNNWSKNWDVRRVHTQKSLMMLDFSCLSCIRKVLIDPHLSSIASPTVDLNLTQNHAVPVLLNLWFSAQYIPLQADKAAEEEDMTEGAEIAASASEADDSDVEYDDNSDKDEESEEEAEDESEEEEEEPVDEEEGPITEEISEPELSDGKPPRIFSSIFHLLKIPSTWIFENCSGS